MNTILDFHSHTTASDGSLSPRLLVERAAKRRLASLAITDHDTFAGLPEAIETAAALDVRIIPGIELEITWNKGVLHLLVLGIDLSAIDHDEVFKLVYASRHTRNEQIKAKMRADGLAIDQYFEQNPPGDSLGRPHFAQALVWLKKAKNRAEAFAKFLTSGQKYYAAKPGIPLLTGLHLCKEWRGVSIIAHPTSLSNDLAIRHEAVHRLLDIGVDGIELYHPRVGLKDRQLLASIAAQRTCLVSGGSDFHEPNRGFDLGHYHPKEPALNSNTPLLNLPWLQT